MDSSGIVGLVLFAGVLALIFVIRRKTRTPGGVRKRHYGSPGPGAAGAIYDMLNEDRRNAIEIIVDGHAERTDPETADGRPDNSRRK